MSVKKKITGRSAKQKGSRAEIKVRNLLRSMYPVELRDNVYRVPLSGAGAIKCDVMDKNDPDSAYEVKCQEKLVLHDWWRQAKSQAGPTRTPVLVVTQNYRPFYFLMDNDDWQATKLSTIYKDCLDTRLMSTRNFMDTAAELREREIGLVVIDDDLLAVIPQNFYLEVKSWQAAERCAIMDTEPQG